MRGVFPLRICVLVLRPILTFPRRAEEAEMSMPGKLFRGECVWTGLADASKSHPERGASR